VTDEGTGVRPDLAPRVFDRNVTGNPAIGDGLGLTLARTLAAADGGRLELLRARPPVFALFLPTTQTTVEPPLQVVSR
jgi:nitrogen-specific signal transduction histidine kinase